MKTPGRLCNEERMQNRRTWRQPSKNTSTMSIIHFNAGILANGNTYGFIMFSAADSVLEVVDEVSISLSFQVVAIVGQMLAGPHMK